MIVGALACGWFAWDVNILDLVLEKVWGPVDKIVLVLVAIAGLHLGVRSLSRPGGRREP